ncbi:unnamed protein product [Arctia plantaginis]|uniref:Peptidase S1 domain-containing protein n=1 Tax=Arctia plantaginis TaxID=874455 RepID=A0A8S0YV57_ARCPL|nr:unnamed protein product [Arctia plantaginis]
MAAKMLTKAAFLLLAVAVIPVPSEYIEPKYIEDLIEEGSRLTSLTPRIVSGWEATLGQHPHQAQLRIERADGQATICGGSFVHHEWMITAAHCSALSINMIVRGGTISISDPTPEYLAPTTQYWTFPTFDASDRRRVQPNDISIVKLEQPITYTRNLRPIRIQPSADANRNYGAQTLHASGFGATWTGGAASRELRWVFLRGVTNDECRLRLSRTLVTETSICAQWFNVTSQSICQGDSGGPLVFTNPEGERILIGVSSFVAGANSGGCHSGIPAAFIRPGFFHWWFTQISGLDFENLPEEEDETPTTTTTSTTTTTTTTPSPPTTLPPTTLPPTTLPPTTLPPTTLPPTTLPPTTVPPTTPEREDGSEEDGSDESEDDSSEEDEDLSQLLKHLQVKVKVKVKVNQFRKKVISKVRKTLN